MIIHDVQETPTYPTGTGKPELWARIYHYIAWRWPSREVVWAVEGPGEFLPPLKPAKVTEVQAFTNDQWQDQDIVKGPLGVWLPAKTTYKVTADVGSDDPLPDDVMAAYDRLDAYMLELDAAGATSITDGDYSISRPANSAGRALQYSGAADLLRAYR